MSLYFSNDEVILQRWGQRISGQMWIVGQWWRKTFSWWASKQRPTRGTNSSFRLWAVKDQGVLAQSTWNVHINTIAVALGIVDWCLSLCVPVIAFILLSTPTNLAHYTTILAFSIGGITWYHAGTILVHSPAVPSTMSQKWLDREQWLRTIHEFDSFAKINPTKIANNV